MYNITVCGFNMNVCDSLYKNLIIPLHRIHYVHVYNTMYVHT